MSRVREVSARVEEGKARESKTPCTVYLTPSRWTELTSASGELGVSRNGLITFVLEAYLDERREAKKGKKGKR